MSNSTVPEGGTIFFKAGDWYYPPMISAVLIRGSGDVGSAVAHTLFNAGYAAVLHDAPKPSATRRRMSFCDAIFDGGIVLEGVKGLRFDNLAEWNSSQGT
jgi:hypothetical protein